MSDTVKLIIEIPKEDYEFTKGAKMARVFPSEYYVKLILKGIPLDDVKTEIKTFTITEKSEYDTGFNDAVLKCFNVLDNIGKESEVKLNE